MNIEEKTKLAHEYFRDVMAFIRKEGINHEFDLIVEESWEYADAMEAEAEKRIKAEAKEKREAVRKLLSDDGTFLEKEGMHFDDVADLCKTYSSLEFQVDWSVAPNGYDWWAMDEYGSWWFDQEPKWINTEWAGYAFNKHNRSATEEAPSFKYQGDWKDSLRKRPK